jgi:transcriptional regulator with XRE-family HTH domain
MSEIRQQLKIARIQKGLSIRQLSLYSKIPASTLSEFECGSGDLSSTRIERVFRTMGMRILFVPEKPEKSAHL